MPKSLLDTFPDKYSTKQELENWIKEMLKNETLKKRSTNPKDKIKYKILQALIKTLHARFWAKDAVDKLAGHIPLEELLARKLGNKLSAFVKAMENYKNSNSVKDALQSMINGSGTVFGVKIPANNKDIKRNKNKFQALLNAYNDHLCFEPPEREGAYTSIYLKGKNLR